MRHPELLQVTAQQMRDLWVVVVALFEFSQNDFPEVVLHNFQMYPWSMNETWFEDAQHIFSIWLNLSQNCLFMHINS